MHQIRENAPPMQHDISKRANDALLGLVVSEGVLLNYIEQLSIAKIRN